MRDQSDDRSGASNRILSFRELEEKALALGFSAFGATPAAKLSLETERLKAWLKDGCQAGMEYMGRNVEKREDISLLVPEARSVIVTLTNYYTTKKQIPGAPLIARYALGKDYHWVIKERLRQLMLIKGIEGRCFVDSAPVLEHEWARRAGLGWVGKNTLLLNRQWGSFCFIGIIVTTGELDAYSLPQKRQFCGNCDRCVRACPTGALSAYRVDARKCISYQTIENKEEEPAELKRLAGGRIFGCDLCQEVCPWNRQVPEHTVSAFVPLEEVLFLTKEDWKKMDDLTFRRLFEKTPLERTGREKIISNL